MRAVFLGTPRTAVPFLDILLDAGHHVPLVVTQPDRPAGRSGKPKPPPVKARALEAGIEVIQPRAVRKARFLERLREARPEILVVVAYGRILPVPVIEAFPLGAVNVHFSLLPRFRGAAPVQWCLARGESVTGVTTMKISEGMDEGDILLQRETAIEPGEHAPALQDRLVILGTELLVETLDGLRRGDLEGRPQDPSAADHAPLLRREDGEPSTELPAREIEGRVRGFDPWPGVWFLGNGRRVRLREATALEGIDSSHAPGRIAALEGDRLVMACGGGSRLAIEMLQPEGKRPQSGRDAVNGRLLRPGDELEPLRKGE